ncbi:MAG: tripartite tricarboxylate transporter substrate-binding protein [Solirubrobacteraceae bacterium]|nr:tripartite tricarboxylate transporter substrate-binding protein [Solirubrobacteraceae bacterium]
MRKNFWRSLAVLSSVLMTGASARAADFYEGKTITIVVGFTPGGTYDQMARFYSRHLPRFLPGKPTVIVQNMPGAGSMVATSHLYNAAARDGTVLGVIGGGTVWEAILGNPQARYDPKAFNWVGGKSRDNITCLVWHTSPIRTIEDVRTREVVVGSTGPGSRTMTFPKALNELAGTKFKIVAGYPGGNEITNALEKGEVEGYCGWALGSLKQRAPAWYNEKKLRFLVQFATERDRELADVPLATDLAKTPAASRIMEFLTSDATLAWTLLAPPGVPAERVALLRTAFEAMLKDPAALAEAEREKLEIGPVSGADLQALVERLAETPAETIAAIKVINNAK